MRIVREKRLTARGVYGFWPANAIGDDIAVYKDDAGAPRLRGSTCCGSRSRSPTGGRIDRSRISSRRRTSMAPDYIGAFAVTAGIGVDELVKEYERQHDDYSAIIIKALADRLAEAFAEFLHAQARQDWGYGGRRGAVERGADRREVPRHPAGVRVSGLSGSHGEGGVVHSARRAVGRRDVDRDVRDDAAASVSGLYLSHPQAKYFNVGRIGRDQLEDYAARKGTDRRRNGTLARAEPIRTRLCDHSGATCPPSASNGVTYVVVLVAAGAAFFLIQRGGATLTAGLPAAESRSRWRDGRTAQPRCRRRRSTSCADRPGGGDCHRADPFTHPGPGAPAAGHRRSHCRHSPGALAARSGDLRRHSAARRRAVAWRHRPDRRRALHVLVGLELHLGAVRDRARQILFVSHAGIAVPFVLGAWLAFGLYPRLATADVSFTSFALFMGVAMAVTAFPVLARILADRGLTATPIGTMALACAAVGDASAWCLLAVVVGVAKARIGDGLIVGAAALVYVVIMFAVVRPALVRFASRWEGRRVAQEAAAVLFIALLASAAVTEAIGIHAIFGAFLLGAIVPHDSAVARAPWRGSSVIW